MTGPVGVDPLDQRIDRDILAPGDLPQAIPELVFQRDGRLVTREPYRVFEHGRMRVTAGLTIGSRKHCFHGQLLKQGENRPILRDVQAQIELDPRPMSAFDTTRTP